MSPRTGSTTVPLHSIRVEFIRNTLFSKNEFRNSPDSRIVAIRSLLDAARSQGVKIRLIRAATSPNDTNVHHLAQRAQTGRQLFRGRLPHTVPPVQLLRRQRRSVGHNAQKALAHPFRTVARRGKSAAAVIIKLTMYGIATSEHARDNPIASDSVGMMPANR